MIIGRSNRWRRNHNVSELMARTIIEQVQGETCPLCYRSMKWTDKGIRLEFNQATGEVRGFAHMTCRPDTVDAGTWEAYTSLPPVRVWHGRPYIPEAPAKQESLL